MTIERASRLFRPLIIKSLHALDLVKGLAPGEETASLGVYQPTGAKALLYNVITREFNARLTMIVPSFGKLTLQHCAELENVLEYTFRDIQYGEPEICNKALFQCGAVNNTEASLAEGRIHVDWIVQLSLAVNFTTFKFNSWRTQAEADEQWQLLGQAA